jgi:hypothetical protein
VHVQAFLELAEKTQAIVVILAMVVIPEMEMLAKLANAKPVERGLDLLQ